LDRTEDRIVPHSLTQADIVVIPGRGGSCPQHWQSHFERAHPWARRVEQEEWEEVDAEQWALTIDAAVRQASGPVLAVAHSFGCLALAQAVNSLGTPLAAALLVAPANPLRFAVDEALIGQRPPLPSLLVASDNDPWLGAAEAAVLAERWGSRYLNLGRVGHINVASGFGAWPQATQLAAEVWRRRREGCAAGPDFSFLPGLAPLPAEPALRG
jgi:predicted alpha/beta hydrolase family esterase